MKTNTLHQCRNVLKLFVRERHNDLYTKEDIWFNTYWQYVFPSHHVWEPTLRNLFAHDDLSWYTGR